MLAEAGLGTEDEVTASILQLMMKNGRWSRGQGRPITEQGAEPAPAAAPQPSVPNVPQAPAGEQPKSALEQVMGLGAGQTPRALGEGSPKTQRPLPMGVQLRGEGTIEAGAPEAPVPPATEAEPEAAAQTAGQDASQRYTLENGKPMAEGTENDFVLKDGQRAWGRVTEELSGGDEDVPVGEVRVKVGRPGERGMGLLHAKGHEQDFINVKFKGAEDYLEHTLGNFNLILPVGDGKHFIAVDTNQKTSPSAILAWRNEDGGYYDLISAYPARRRTINSQKKKSPPTGRPTPAPAPAPAPSAMDTAISSKPESDATVAYGSDDLMNETIPQPAAEVKEEQPQTEPVKAPEGRENQNPASRTIARRRKREPDAPAPA